MLQAQGGREMESKGKASNSRKYESVWYPKVLTIPRINK
jgi:hypothetical protein